LATILVVDDDAPIGRLCRSLLAQEAHLVVYAPDGKRALEALNAGAIDLIILDLEMPVMDGRSFFYALAALPERPPVLILSAYDAPGARRELGAEGALSKPFDVDALLAEVTYLLG
jgi:DNA-binding response OmpR family regulator